MWITLTVGNEIVNYFDGFKFRLFVSADNISDYVEKVEFKLHPTFSPPQEVQYVPPFSLEKTAWGYFTATINVHFKAKYKRNILSIFWYTKCAEVSEIQVGLNNFE